MAFLYPWGNTQQLNLDWILKKIKELETGGGAGADLEEVANALITLTHRSTTQYRRWDYCFYNGKLYRALVDTTGAFAPADWREVVLGDDVSVLTRLINALNTDNIDNASNVSGNTASDALNNLLTALENLDSDDIDNASQVTGTSVTDALDNLNGAIDAITPLTTTPTSGSTKGITSGAVYTALNNVETKVLTASDMVFDSGVSLHEPNQYPNNFILRIGKICILYFSIKLENVTGAIPAKKIIGYIPTGFRPIGTNNDSYYGIGDTGLGDGKAQQVQINFVNGVFSLFPTNTGTTYAIGSMVYFCE